MSPPLTGDTTYASVVADTASVHPRLCGEHPYHTPAGSNSNGSSPPVRGTHSLGEVGSRLCRFIPACAGNTATSIGRAIPMAVHPRLCGEHATGESDLQNYAGSSPPVRGTLLPRVYDAHLGRFIPACAGNTTTPGRLSGRYAVHPRLCGEHSAGATSDGNNIGSSPPVRGTLGWRDLGWKQDRFIPACAGNTFRKT